MVTDTNAGNGLRKEDCIKTKRRNKYSGKEDISREVADSIITKQIDRIEIISKQNEETSKRLRDGINILYNKKVGIDTEKFEHLTQHFIYKIEEKTKKVQRPSKGLMWYIAMWAITLISAFTAGYFMKHSSDWKESATYWNKRAIEYEEQIQKQENNKKEKNNRIIKKSKK